MCAMFREVCQMFSSQKMFGAVSLSTGAPQAQNTSGPLFLHTWPGGMREAIKSADHRLR